MSRRASLLQTSRYAGVHAWRAARDASDVAFNLETLARFHDDRGRTAAAITVSGSDWDLLVAAAHPFAAAARIRTHPLCVQRADPLAGVRLRSEQSA